LSVVAFKLSRRFAYADGKSFGDTGAYEQIDGILTFAVDPAAEANRLIVDLARAPRDEDGRVRFTADFSVVTPVIPDRGSKRLLIELPNRGRRRVVDSLNRSGAEPAASAAPGDGFLFERGLTVASIGWQWDVYADDVLMGLDPALADLGGEVNPGRTVVEIRPNQRQSTWLLADRIHKPLRAANLNEPDATLYVKDFEDGEEMLLPRTSWRFGRETADEIVPSDEHVYLDGGFEPGKYYQIVYSTKDAPVAGCGLLALRDATSFLKFDSAALMPGIGELKHAIGFGVSQTGRMLRHFLYLGLNVDEQGRKVFDGMLPHVAGGRVGAFNHRYGQPSNQSYPSFGHLFPFTDSELTDPLTGRSDGLLKRLDEKQATPKIIYTNSSSEYWRGDGSLTCTDPEGEKDLEGHPNTRVYHFAGTQHGAGSLPQTRGEGAENALGLYAYNVVDYTPLFRAALVNLEKWISDDIKPPPSAHARIEDETAVTRGTVLNVFDGLTDQVTPNRTKMWAMRTTDLGARAGEGVGEYPPVEGESYACLVSAVDADGNEVSGIRLPDLTRPVATHAGWNLRDPATGSPDDVVPMIGFTRWFPVTAAERTANKDTRLSIAERYQSREQYLGLVKRDAELLARDGYILDQDIGLVTQNAADRYDAAVAGDVVT
jgi:hypothetical protein